MSVSKRLREIAHDNSLKNKDFDISIGKSVGYLSTLLKQGSYPSVEVLIRIMENYPKYNINWILTGKGNKFKDINMVAEEAAKYSNEMTLDELIDKKIDARMEELKEVVFSILGGNIEDELQRAKFEAAIKAGNGNLNGH